MMAALGLLLGTMGLIRSSVSIDSPSECRGWPMVLDLVVVVMGLFGITEVLCNLESPRRFVMSSRPPKKDTSHP